MDAIIYPLLEIDNQIINLFHIGELIQLSKCNKAANQKITNFKIYISAKQFYTNFYKIADNKINCCPLYTQYFLAACYQGKFEIIRYLFEKYNLTSMLDNGYDRILRTNNISLIKQYRLEIGVPSPYPYIRWFLSPAVIDYIYGPNYLPCSWDNFLSAMGHQNWKLMTYIYFHNKYNLDLFNLDCIYYLLSRPCTIGGLKWLINNCKIDASINKYFEDHQFIWMYYNSKYNKAIYSNPDEKFLIIFGRIILEDLEPDILSELLPIKNQIDQHIIRNHINQAKLWQKFELVQYLIRYFIIDYKSLNYMHLLAYSEPGLINCILEKMGPDISKLFEKPQIFQLCYNKLLIEILFTKKPPLKIKFTEDIFIHAIVCDSYQMLKFILANSELDLSKIKNSLYNINIRGPEAVRFLLDIGVFNFEDIKKLCISDLWVLQTDLLFLVLQEIKKAEFKLDINITYLFGRICEISKTQAKIFYEDHKQFIKLNKNQKIWLGLLD